jgi:hypothetical protein
MSRDMSNEWDYRVIRTQAKDRTSLQTDQLHIQEVYYDEDRTMMAHTIDLNVTAESIPELRKQLQRMIWSLDQPILNEMSNPRSDMENMDEIGEDGHGNRVYIYESPDGGATLYRREVGKNDREEIEKTL